MLDITMLHKRQVKPKRKEFKEGFTYLHMKKRYQRLFGWLLLISGISLILSTFAPELLNYDKIVLSQNDLISILLGIIISYIGYKGAKGKW